MKRLSRLMPEKVSSYEIDSIAIIIRLRQGSSSGSRAASGAAKLDHSGCWTVASKRGM
jgi:hypothetical protein